MVSSQQSEKTVTLRVLRANPAVGLKRHYQTFQVPLEPGMTVLSALLAAKERMDHSIAIRFSCRMASCGSCGMKINGIPRLACYTQVADFSGKAVIVEPLDTYPLVRDLVTDFDGFFSKHASIKPFTVRRNEEEQETPNSEYDQSPAELEDFLQFSYCIKCGLCNAACPTVRTDPGFIGPQALGQAYRYTADSRDEGAEARIKAIDNNHGIWRCHFAGACSFVCPKGVDPALAIQRLRRLVFSKNITKRSGSPLLAKHEAQT
ncbi:MAG: succinate dehydrogenase/fumarate reductase iron-sulfur subunit [Candidatus Bathyarchaeia archaeon]